MNSEISEPPVYPPGRGPTGNIVFVQIDGPPGRPLVNPRSNDPARKWIEDFERNLKAAFAAAGVNYLQLGFIGRPSDAGGGILTLDPDLEPLLATLRKTLDDSGLLKISTVHLLDDQGEIHAWMTGEYFDKSKPFTIFTALRRLLVVLRLGSAETRQRHDEIMDGSNPPSNDESDAGNPPSQPPPPNQKPETGNSGDIPPAP